MSSEVKLKTLVPTAATDEAHEALCRRCGISCHFAVPVNGTPMVVDELHCKFLQREAEGTYRCTVYAERFERAPWCHDVAGALAGGYLAQDCPYARGVANYRGKIRLPVPMAPLVLPAIRAEVARLGVPIGASPESAVRLLEGDGSQWTFAENADGTRYVFTQITV